MEKLWGQWWTDVRQGLNWMKATSRNTLTGVNPDRAVILQPEKKGIRWKFYPEYLKERQPELLFLSW